MSTEENYELYHHGIRGQRWGIRRFQNKDGTLTKAGERRYYKEMERAKADAKVLRNRKRVAAKFEKLNALRRKNSEEDTLLSGRNQNNEDSKKTKTEPKQAKKPISQMTNEELLAYKQRLQIEKDTYDLQQKVAQLNPPKESAAKKLISKAGPLIINAVWSDVAKPALNKYLEQKLKAPPGELDKLKAEAEKWKQKASIAKDKKGQADSLYDLNEITNKHIKREKEREKENRDELRRLEDEIDVENEAKVTRKIDERTSEINRNNSYIRMLVAENENDAARATDETRDATLKRNMERIIEIYKRQGENERLSRENEDDAARIEDDRKSKMESRKREDQQLRDAEIKRLKSELKNNRKVKIWGG